MQNLAEQRREFQRALRENGIIDSSDECLTFINRRRNDASITLSVIVGGLFPNILRVFPSLFRYLFSLTDVSLSLSNTNTHSLILLLSSLFLRTFFQIHNPPQQYQASIYGSLAIPTEAKDVKLYTAQGSLFLIHSFFRGFYSTFLLLLLLLLQVVSSSILVAPCSNETISQSHSWSIMISFKPRNVCNSLLPIIFCQI